MSTPTPDPSGLSPAHFAGYSRDELVAALIRERNERVSQRRDLVGVKRERNRLRATVDALDLPARDARIRAEAWRTATELVERTQPESSNPTSQRGLEAYRTALVAALRLSERLTRPAATPAELAVEPSAVPAEGSGLAAMLRAAAAGRREYAGNAPESMRPTLECEAATLDAAATLADGDLEPMYGWLPSWRWSPEMAERLRETGRQVLAVPVEGSGQGPELCPSCGATVWPVGTPWTDRYRRLVLGKFPEVSRHPRRPRCLRDAGGVQCALSAGHVPPCTPMRPLDTPEGATTNEH